MIKDAAPVFLHHQIVSKFRRVDSAPTRFDPDAGFQVGFILWRIAKWENPIPIPEPIRLRQRSTGFGNQARPEIGITKNRDAGVDIQWRQVAPTGAAEKRIL